MGLNIELTSVQLQSGTSGCFEISVGISLCFVIFAIEQKRLKVLCEIDEGMASSKCWMLPGGGIYSEGVRKSAERGLQKFVRCDHIFHEQLQTFGGNGRTPLTVAYYALLSAGGFAQVSSSQRELQWWDVDQLPALSADHTKLVEFAIHNLRLKAFHEPVLFHLLPAKFTLLQFQQAYETVFGVHISKSNFRRKIAKFKFLVPCQEWQQDVAHRAARLYEFDEKVYLDLCQNGFLFSF